MQSIFRQVLQTHRNRYKQSKRRCMWSRSIGPTWVARWIPTTSGWLRTSWGKLALQSSVQEGITHRYPQIVPSSFQRLLKPKRGNPGVGGPQKQTKGIYSTINVQYIYIIYIILYIYIYIVTRSLYIYICIHWYTMIYRYTEKIQKAQDDWRISRLKPFLDQRADGGLREIRQLNPPMSNRIKWDSLGNTLIHLKFILSIILKYIHIYIHICWHISSMLKKNADSLLDASWDHLDA